MSSQPYVELQLFVCIDIIPAITKINEQTAVNINLDFIFWDTEVHACAK